MLKHPKNPTVRRTWIAAEVLLIAAGLWMGWRLYSQPAITVQITGVSGYNEPQKVWLRFDVALDLTNGSSRTVGISRILVEPDLDDFNEAYGHAVPILSPPLIVEGGTTTHYTAVVTLLNALPLQERTYNVVFRVRLETEDGDFVQEFPAQFEYFQDRSRRKLTLGAQVAR